MHEFTYVGKLRRRVNIGSIRFRCREWDVCIGNFEINVWGHDETPAHPPTCDP